MSIPAVQRVIAIGAAALCFVAVPALSDEKEGAPPAWDQQKVTALAQQLSEAAGKLNKEMNRQRAQLHVGSGQSKAMLQFRDDIRVARNESRHLAKVLSEGRGREETTAPYRRLMSLVRNARVTGRQLMIKAPATEYIAEANEALDGLAPYYPDVKPSQ